MASEYDGLDRDERDVLAVFASAGVPSRLTSVLSRVLDDFVMTLGDIAFLKEEDLVGLASGGPDGLALKLLYRKYLRPMAVTGLTRRAGGRVEAQEAADALASGRAGVEATLVAGGRVLDGQGKLGSVVSTRGGASRVDVAGVGEYVAALGDKAGAIEVVDVSRNNLMDEDLIALGEMIGRLLPNVRVVDAGGNRVHGFTSETKDAVGDAVEALLGLPKLEFLVLSSNPFATKDSLPFFSSISLDALARLVWIPHKFLASESWASLFSLRPEADRSSVIDVVARTHMRFYGPRTVPIGPDTFLRVPPMHVLFTRAREDEPLAHRMAILPSGTIVLYSVDSENGAEHVESIVDSAHLGVVGALDLVQTTRVWAAVHDMKWYNEFVLANE